MAYPASTKTLQVWVQDIDRIAATLKSVAQAQHTRAAAGLLNMDEVRRFFDQLVQANNFFLAAGSVAGIAEYLDAEKQGQVADPVAEFLTMRNAVTATLDWLRANVPQGLFVGTNYKLAFIFPADNTTPSSALIFTAAQTAGYRTQLTALIGTIG